MNKLPTEVLDLIASHCAYHRRNDEVVPDYTTMRDGTLISKRFYPIFMRRLYRDIDIRDISNFLHPDSLQRFLSTMSQAPSLGSYIRILTGDETRRHNTTVLARQLFSGAVENCLRGLYSARFVEHLAVQALYHGDKAHVMLALLLALAPNLEKLNCALDGKGRCVVNSVFDYKAQASLADHEDAARILPRLKDLHTYYNTKLDDEAAACPPCHVDMSFLVDDLKILFMGGMRSSTHTSASPPLPTLLYPPSSRTLQLTRLHLDDCRMSSELFRDILLFSPSLRTLILANHHFAPATQALWTSQMTLASTGQALRDYGQSITGLEIQVLRDTRHAHGSFYDGGEGHESEGNVEWGCLGSLRDLAKLTQLRLDIQDVIGGTTEGGAGSALRLKDALPAGLLSVHFTWTPSASLRYRDDGEFAGADEQGGNDNDSEEEEEEEDDDDDDEKVEPSKSLSKIVPALGSQRKMPPALQDVVELMTDMERSLLKDITLDGPADVIARHLRQLRASVPGWKCYDTLAPASIDMFRHSA
ncbi:hypothetical protein Micbo1qcDRAFT_208444 [Microdochium bolleyi]|uniref:Uncharacterized protein n=1 Tax=Microdochium bolleyi TaxID=196109 RepID=A0A136IQ44_9PEZI|nr:hypothetical protein Micbo1qcDRAFT_208444 [Microdochium bolleyi]